MTTAPGPPARACAFSTAPRGPAFHRCAHTNALCFHILKMLFCFDHHFAPLPADPPHTPPPPRFFFRARAPRVPRPPSARPQFPHPGLWAVRGGDSRPGNCVPVCVRTVGADAVDVVCAGACPPHPLLPSKQVLFHPLCVHVFILLSMLVEALVYWPPHTPTIFFCPPFFGFSLNPPLFVSATTVTTFFPPSPITIALSLWRRVLCKPI